MNYINVSNRIQLSVDLAPAYILMNAKLCETDINYLAFKYVIEISCIFIYIRAKILIVTIILHYNICMYVTIIVNPRKHKHK